METSPVRVVWSCASTITGVQYVTINGATRRQQWSVTSWDMMVSHSSLLPMVLWVGYWFKAHDHSKALILTPQALALSPGNHIALSGNVFPGGKGIIWLDDTNCVGNESSLLDCSHRDVGISNCGHSKDASVICAGEYSWKWDVAERSMAWVWLSNHLCNEHPLLSCLYSISPLLLFPPTFSLLPPLYALSILPFASPHCVLLLISPLTERVSYTLHHASTTIYTIPRSNKYIMPKWKHSTRGRKLHQ